MDPHNGYRRNVAEMLEPKRAPLDPGSDGFRFYAQNMREYTGHEVLTRSEAEYRARTAFFRGVMAGIIMQALITSVIFLWHSF